MLPGQFVEVHVENSPTTFLRRPISVNYVDKSKNELWLLIQLVGDGTRKMAEFRPGDIVNIMLPLGNSFTIPSKEQENKKTFADWWWCWNRSDVISRSLFKRSRF